MRHQVEALSTNAATTSPQRSPSVGLVLAHDTQPARFARVTEQSGFDLLASGEHVLFRRPLLNAFVSLSAAAACTERIRLMTALTLLPLYPAALAAKLASSLDFISDGRLDLGLGVGGEVPEEFAACGVDVHRRGLLTDRAINELLTYFDAADAAPAGAPDMLPKPLQQPSPPIWIGGRSDAALRRTATFAHGWMPYLMTPEQIIAKRSILQQLRREPIKIAAVAFVGLGNDSRRAADDAATHVSRLYGIDVDRVRRYTIGGDGPAVIQGLAEFVAVGVTTLLLNLCATGEAAERMAERAAETVLPALRDLPIEEERFRDSSCPSYPHLSSGDAVP